VNGPTVDVSVLVPVRDGARYLADALDSVLDQDPAPREVIAVDDGSTDDTPSVLRAYEASVRVLHQPASGQAAALNRGVAAATGAWLAFLDADDTWTPGALAARWARAAADPGIDMVSGRVEQFVSPELPDEVKARFRFDPAPSRAQLFGTVLVRRSAFLAVGPLDEALPSAAPVDWISRARATGLPTAEIDDVVLRRRLHRTNMGVVLDHDVTLQALRDVVRAHHARRRGTDDG
jgi:glycosyltransferase involved in cell wall biosynthesis